MTTIMQPPDLDHDAMMKERFGHKIGANGKLERRIVWNLIKHLESNGFRVYSTDDREEEFFTSDGKEAMEKIFNLDEVYLKFVAKDDKSQAKRQQIEAACMLPLTQQDLKDNWHYVFLVLGNGEDIICDWTYARDDNDGFNAAMNAFDVERCY